MQKTLQCYFFCYLFLIKSVDDNKETVCLSRLDMASITIFFKPTKDTNKQKTFQSDSEREKSALEKTVEKHLPLCAEKTFIQELSKSTRPKVCCKVPASIRYEVAKFAAVRGPTAAVSHFNKRN